MKLLFLLVYFFSFSSHAELSCSNNATKIIYINGVNTLLEKNTRTNNVLLDKLNSLKSNLDKNSKVDYSSLFNESFELDNDLQESLAGLAELLPEDKKKNLWHLLARNEILKINSGEQRVLLNKKVEEAFNQIYGKKYKVDPKTHLADQGYFSETEMYAFLQRHNSNLSSILRNAAASEAVIENLKTKIIEAHDTGANKVIVIAHSQGNIILSTAIRRILNENFYALYPIDYNWFYTTVGYMQLASPTPNLVSGLTSRYINLDIDTVVGGAGAFLASDPLAANYESRGLKVVGSSFMVKLLSFIQVYNLLSPDPILNHGINEVYLSKIATAKKINGGVSTMEMHFENAMKEIAHELKSNCIPEIKPSYATCKGERSLENGRTVWKADGKVNSVMMSVAGNTEQGIKNASGNECLSAYYGGNSEFLCNLIDPSSTSIKIKLRTIASKNDYISTVTNPCHSGRVLSNEYESFSY